MVELFCDARGEPPRVAAVLFDAGDVLFTDVKPTDEMMRIFTSRKDSQIMGLELLSIALCLSTFGARLAGKIVRIWTDNIGGEKALGRGSAKADDHNLIVHAIWLLAARMNAGLWIERVGTHDNIADSPSREEYGVLEALGAVKTEPFVANAFVRPAAWESVSL